MSRKPLCDKTRLWGDSGLGCHGPFCVRLCARVCVFNVVSLFLWFPYSSVSRVATLSEGRVSWASSWASVERSQLRLHLRRPPLILLIPASIFFPLSVCLSVCLYHPEPHRDERLSSAILSSSHRAWLRAIAFTLSRTRPPSSPIYLRLNINRLGSVTPEGHWFYFVAFKNPLERQ